MADRSGLAATVIAGVIFGTVFLFIKPSLALILSELFAILATISSMMTTHRSGRWSHIIGDNLRLALQLRLSKGAVLVVAGVILVSTST